jgi:S1-C subfamily serine protease
MALPTRAQAEPEVLRTSATGGAGMPETPVTGYATAFVVAPGYLVTNAHAARGPLRLYDADRGQRYAVRVVALDDQHDLALLRAEVPGSALPMGEGVPVTYRTRAFVIGYPDPARYGTGRKLAPGWVRSPAGHEGNPFLTLYLSAAGGNSGSPLCDAQGRVIGVVTGGITAPLMQDGAPSRTEPMPTATALPALLAFLRREQVGFVQYGLAGPLEQVASALAPSVYLVEQLGEQLGEQPGAPPDEKKVPR